MDAAAKSASTEQPVHYERHRPERTLLYQLVQEYYPAFKAHLEAQGTGLPRYVEKEFEGYLQCGRLDTVFYACNARPAMPSAWSLTVVVRSGRLSAVRSQDAMKVDVNENLE